MTKILIVIGKSGTGKDTLVGVLSEMPFFNKVITTTTRPKRDYEIDGLNYHFITPEEFAHKILDGSIIEASCFNENWFYGTQDKDYDSKLINILSCDPTRVSALLEASSEYDIDIIYLDTKDKVRLIRCLNREDNPDVSEIIRRYKTDEVDFSNLDFNYTVIENNGNLVKTVEDCMLHLKDIKWIE